MAAHRYWRLLMNVGPAGAGVFAVNELQLMTAIGGANVAVIGTGGASASSTFGGFSAAAAFDGVTAADGWASTAQVSEWLRRDFGAGNDKDIVEFAITARGGFPNQAPTGGVLQYSDDDIAWTNSIPFSTAQFNGGETRWFNNVAVGATTFGETTSNYKSNNVWLPRPSKVAATSAGAGSAAAPRPHSGLSYAEFVITTLTGTVAVGLMSPSYNPAVNTTLGTDANSLGYRSGGTVVLNGATLATLAAYVQGDRIDMAVDPFNWLVWFRVNGGNWNNNVANDPATGVGGIDFSGLTRARVFPAVGFSLTGGRIDAHFAAADFSAAAPAGYSSYDVVQYVKADGEPEGYRIPAEVAQVVEAAARSAILLREGMGRMFSPAGAITTISGIVEEESIAVPDRLVEVFDRETGERLGFAYSDGIGAYSIPALGRSKVRVVASDPTSYNSLAYDNVTPA